jgi:predicted ATPase
MEVENLGTNSYQVVITIDGHRSNLLDVGFGVSQVLPVITLAYFAPEGSTVILGEPELNLHPLAQTALGDLFVEVAKERNVQFLVETHSEHLFRRIQTLIAQERITPDECSLYFASRQNGSCTLEPLRVNAYGRVENWPDKFFGDTAGEVERQMESMFERMEKDELDG